MCKRKCLISYFPQKAMTPFYMLPKSAGNENTLQMCDINNNTTSTYEKCQYD